MKKFGFPKRYHLKTGQFSAVYQAAQIHQNSLVRVYYKENNLPYPRLGLSVSRRVGGAVRRNRIKRLFREAFRLTFPEIQGKYDFILLPRFSKEKKVSFLEIQQNVKELLLQIS